VIELSLMQNSKALESMVVRDEGRSRLVREMQPKKEPSSMVVTVDGMDMVASEMQPEKDLARID